MIFGQVETAIINHLQAASDAGVLGYALRAQVDTLPSDFDDSLPNYIQQFPGMWTTWSGFRKTRELGDGGVVGLATFGVFVGAANARNEAAQRMGAGGDVGAYQLAMDAAGLVMGQTFGLPIGALVLGDITPLSPSRLQHESQCTLFGLTFTSEVEIERLDAPLIETPGAGRFLTFNVAWDVPPHTGEPDFTQSIKPPQDD